MVSYNSLLRLILCKCNFFSVINILHVWKLFIKKIKFKNAIGELNKSIQYQMLFKLFFRLAHLQDCKIKCKTFWIWSKSLGEVKSKTAKYLHTDKPSADPTRSELRSILLFVVIADSTDKCDANRIKIKHLVIVALNCMVFYLKYLNGFQIKKINIYFN